MNGCSTLAEKTAKIDAHMLQEEMLNTAHNSENIFPVIKKMTEENDNQDQESI